MKAGRELDLRVARIVFGITRFYHNEQDIIWFVDGKERKILPFYSTVISDAWKIIEMSEYYEISTNKHLNKVHVSLRLRTSSGDSYGDAYADTEYLAICLAALDAVSKRNN